MSEIKSGKLLSCGFLLFLDMGGGLHSVPAFVYIYLRIYLKKSIDMMVGKCYFMLRRY